MTRLSKRPRQKSPSSLLRCDHRPKQTGTPKGYQRIGEYGAVRPEDTPAGKLHVAKWRKWLANPNGVTFAEFIQSAYC